ncbi:uncharacterized protein LOC101899969 [Musca domestica]|uniref:Uncharacterized protein LOC101899969 n=1 Tax=Musca domestica TaxID=7370 RepID=A0A1I8MUN9_MUSDO|nr:uncharacterized protein LOC101899969 [Musca domestica]
MDAAQSTSPELSSNSPEPKPSTVPTQLLREKIREYTKKHREAIRAEVSDSLRFQLGEIKERIQELDNVTEKDVAGLAARIKRRKHATIEDMYRLSHAFLQNVANIQAFNKIPGSMQVLIKELTGNDSERQMSAAECLCNLSLGEGPVCEKIASAAGSYLVTYLHSTESQLVRLCLWIIANILATGQKCASVLMKMQLLPQLWKMYCDDEIADPLLDYREDAAICLQLMSLNAPNLMTQEDRNFVLQQMADKNPTCVAAEYHLFIVFHILFTEPHIISTLYPPDALYLLNFSLINLNNTNNFLTQPQRLKILYSIRVLGNLLVVQPLIYSTLLLQVSCVWKSSITALLNKLFAFHNEHLSQEALWLLKIILHLEEENAFMQPNILESIHIFEECMPFDDKPIEEEAAAAMAV